MLAICFLLACILWQADVFQGSDLHDEGSLVPRASVEQSFTIATEKLSSRPPRIQKLPWTPVVPPNRSVSLALDGGVLHKDLTPTCHNL